MRRLLLVPALLACFSMTGCAKVDQSKARVTDAIDRTEQVARDFTYSDRAAGHTTVVRGSIEDDLRYSLAATLDGSPAAGEVVVDDARALQVTDGPLLQRMSSTEPSAAVPVPAAAPVVPADLAAGHWVVDRTGAIGLVAGSVQNADVVGRNPLLDAITAMEYARRAVNAATDVQKFNPDSPSYRPRLDPFPRPAAGITRYDLVPPILQPHSSGAGGQLQTSLPDTVFFRLMGIYVKDGVVVEVREKIDIETRLRDPQSNLSARLGDYVKVRQGASVRDQATALLTALNRRLPSTGKPPLRLREMDLRFTSLGHSASVSLPTDAAPGNLATIGAHGQLLYRQR